MKNNVLLIVLVVLISVAAAVGLLFGINNAINVQISPMSGHMMQVAVSQQRLNDKIATLEKKIDELETKMKQQPQAPAMAQQPPSEDFNKVYDIPVGDSPVWGNKNAKVTVIEFSDFQCPFCVRFYGPLKEAALAYPDQVKIVIKNYPLPFHPNARPAAKLAFAANLQDKYYEMVELLLNNGADTSEAKIKEYADTLKINAKKLAEDFKNKDAEWEAKIVADEQLAQNVDARGTPTFYLNGKKTNARDVASWKAAFDKALAE